MKFTLVLRGSTRLRLHWFYTMKVILFLHDEVYTRPTQWRLYFLYVRKPILVLEGFTAIVNFRNHGNFATSEEMIQVKKVQEMIIYWCVFLHNPQQVLVTCRCIHKFFKPNCKQQITAAMKFKHPPFAKEHEPEELVNETKLLLQDELHRYIHQCTIIMDTCTPWYRSWLFRIFRTG